MKYEKPEVQVVASALDAIQGMDKQINPHPDSSEVAKTVPAYSAND
jgi:hypothetical protein